jgi:hypothetical protein
MEIKMKLIRRDRLTTSINYFGVTFDVTDEYKWIATDRDGKVCLFSDKPIIIERYGMWCASIEECRICQIGIVDLEGLDWKSSLYTWRADNE